MRLLSTSTRTRTNTNKTFITCASRHPVGQHRHRLPLQQLHSLLRRLRRLQLAQHRRLRQPHVQGDARRHRGLVRRRRRGRFRLGSVGRQPVVASSLPATPFSSVIHGIALIFHLSASCRDIQAGSLCSPEISGSCDGASRCQSCYQIIANISRQPQCSELREAGQRGVRGSRTKYRESRTLHWSAAGRWGNRRRQPFNDSTI